MSKLTKVLPRSSCQVFSCGTKEIADILAKHFFGAFVQGNGRLSAFEYFSDSELTFVQLILTSHMVTSRHALTKPSGLLRDLPVFLKHCADSTVVLLFTLFLLSLLFHLPLTLRILPLCCPLVSKGEKEMGANCHAVALSSVICHSLEQVLAFDIKI